LKEIYLNPDIEIIKSLPTLLWPVHHEGLGILETNQLLQSIEYDPYPSFLIAFATGECGDFWVINSNDYSIKYFDPDNSVEENLINNGLQFDSFSEWFKNMFASHQHRV
jgi:hypothetical protein